MTFINARILRKRPNLFVTPKRNYGNLLIKYESGTDGTAPDPDPPAPDPVTFTTSWTTNAGVVTANLTGISNHRTTEVIVLSRDDGTVLATLDENKVGDWDLQHDEGTTYGSYTYNIRLDGVIKSTFTRDYQPNVPTFTTNFFSNTAKVISCGIDTITNPHDSYSVRLARPDDTILDTQVLNDATPFFLQFTESDYGTYDYKLLLSKWTTTSTSNPNIPPESYFVDTVIATHTQTYVRPTPTYTASFSTSELTLTASITSITNAHNSFAITLERDDGTELSTHTLADGETSFTFTQTETSYATFNYVVKINGTQTDTYSATYTPPPTPTFDIALTNDDLAITATLTNIVNPDPYYTFMIHDANDTHLDGHTFATGDTTVVLTWTETSYGEKTYTKLLNGASIGTETITLTDPNASSTTYNLDSTDFPIITPSSGDWSSWAEYRYRSDDVLGYVYYDLWNTQAANGGGFSYDEDDNINNDGGYQIRVSKTTGDWSDYPHTGSHPPTGVSTTNGNVALGTLFTFVKPSGTYQNKSQTPWDTPSTPVEPNVLTHTSSALYNSYEWRYHSQTTTHYRYGMYHIGNDVFLDVPTSLIQVGKSGQSDYNTWSDANTLVNPNQVVDNGTTVSLNYSGTSYSFNKPTNASWISTPTYRTGTSQAFSLNVGSGSWANEGYTLFVDDNPTTASSGVVVNGVRQYEWDLKNSSNNFWSGADHYFYFIPGSSATSGLWYLGGSLASRSGSVITDINGGGSFNETNAFVDGLVPYGDIP